MGADVFMDLTFLDHTGNPIQPLTASYRVDDLTNAVPMIQDTAIVYSPASGTGSIGFTGTGAVAGDILTVSGINTGILLPNDIISLPGLPDGTQVISQLTGTTGINGTYRINYPSPNAISATVFTTRSSIFYNTAMEYGVFSIGDTLISPQIPATTIQALAPNPNPSTLSGTLWLLAGPPQGNFVLALTVAGPIPSTYVLQIPGAALQMTHNWQGSQICQIWVTSTWKDPATNQLCTAQGVSVLELCAIQTPNGAL